MKKVLIVEDDSILAFVHQKFVEQLGYKVTACVETGAAAIEEVKKEEPDILILGDMDGIETMGEIRKFSTVPVVYVTGNSNPTVRQRADATPGKVDFLSKPINLGLLQTTFHRLA
jgi:two-component system, response regulator PdtaR